MSVGGYIDEHCPDLSLHDILSELEPEVALEWLMNYFKKAGHDVVLEELGNWVYDDESGLTISTIQTIHEGMS